MNDTEFIKLIDEQIQSIQNTFKTKCAEYSSENDRLINFKNVAKMDTKPEIPERALLGMWKKHLVSVFDIVDKLEIGVLPTETLLNEKIGDSINYLILLKALIKERMTATYTHLD